MHTTTLPAPLGDDVVLTDAGLETVLIFEHGVDLPAFAAFPLLDDAPGRALLTGYYAAFLELAAARGTGFVFETPTWRANPAWGPAVGYDADGLRRINHDAVTFGRGLADRHGVPTLVSGCVGPRGDGYVPGDAMTPEQAFEHHRVQVGDLAEAGADLVSAFTLAGSEEAAGFVAAASSAGVPAVVGFTVETDGLLPSGEELGAAIERVDRLTGGYAAWFMVNCAHPEHVAPALARGAGWRQRIGGLRANASRLSHAELDAAETLDAGDPAELAAGYLELRPLLPALRVLGGCCGTDLRHVTAIADAWLAA